MANLVITAANVLAGSDATKESGTAGEAITAGQVVYRATSGLYMLADANSATAAARQPRGIALHAAATGQPLAIQRSGSITIGATMTAGTDYYLSDTPGAIAPRADIGSGEYVALIGMAESTTLLRINIHYTGVAL
jgi:hypothetical protein